ncbi:pLS20_p028 family conjugation system transmembrane protein [Enterococcus faecalis]|uniref:pLS20_p028 family conjugation system transmembrane protein n=1 Tax=Enterococcus faecalis TaxID=1351 RepID=UPI0024547C7A|nr:hypothetical protein [Enterococcus faecalis]MDH5039487.1 hypothetical protein [Enterococcus faecalis]
MFQLMDINQDIVDIMNRYKDHIDITNPIFNFFQKLLGWVAIGLYYVSSALEKIFSYVFNIFGFMGDSSLFDGIHKVFILVGGICLLGAVIYMGLQYTMGYKVDIKNFIRNVILVVIIFGAVPTMISASGTILKDINRQVTEAPTGENHPDRGTQPDNMSLAPIKDNVHDFLWLQKNNFPEWDNVNPQNAISNKSVYQTDFGEVIPNDRSLFDNIAGLVVKDDKNNIFQFEPKKNVDNPDKDYTEYTPLKKHTILKGIDQGWARYSVSYIPMFCQQILLILLLAFSFLKIVKLGTEMILVQQFVPVIAFSDVHDGTKIKGAFQTIINTMIVMVFICAIMRLFLIISQSVNSYLPATMPYRSLIYTFFQYGIFLGCMGGVGAVEKQFGISTNLKSEGMAASLAGIGAGVGAFKAAKFVGGTAYSGMKFAGSRAFGNNSDKPRSNADNPNLRSMSYDNGQGNASSENTQAGQEEAQNNGFNGGYSNADNPNLKDNLHPEFDSSDPQKNESNDKNSNADNPNLKDNLHPEFDSPDPQKNESNGRTSNADNPNLKDNLHPEFDSPDVEDNETSGGYSNADNPNLQENIHSNFDNPNLNDNEFDSVPNPSLSQIEANNNNLNTEQTKNSDRSDQKKKKTKKQRNFNLMNKAMTYGQVIDEEGQTRGKPAGEDPKEW